MNLVNKDRKTCLDGTQSHPTLWSSYTSLRHLILEWGRSRTGWSAGDLEPQTATETMPDLTDGVLGTCISSLQTAHQAVINQLYLGFRVQLHPGKRLCGLAFMLAGYNPN